MRPRKTHAQRTTTSQPSQARGMNALTVNFPCHETRPAVTQVRARATLVPMSLRTVKDKVVLVTGASSGIGEAIARQAVREGARVVLFARRRERVDGLAAELGASAQAFAGDVTRDGDV